MTSGQGFPTQPFLRFWRAGAVSGFGTYVTLFVLQVLVVRTLDGSATDVGWLNAARWLPFLVLGLVVGAIVDGRRRLPLMVGTDLVQAAVLLAIPLLWWLDRLTLPSLMLIVLAYGTASVINSAASMSLLPRLVPRPHLQPAHARIDGADAVASTAGPSLGGLLVGVLGAPLAVLVDSLTYLYSALTLRRIELDEPPPRRGVTVRGLLRDVVEGVRWVYRGSGLMVLALATHGWFVAHAVVGVVLAPYVLDGLDLSASTFGIIGTAGGLGAVVGAAVTTWVGRRVGTGRTIIGCHLLTSLGVLATVAAGHDLPGGAAIALLMVGQGLYGLSMGMSNSHETSYRQLVTPDALQARTNTTMRAFNRAVIVLVSPVAGILGDAWGLRPMLLVSAAIFLLVAGVLAASPFRRVRAPV